MDGWAGGRAWVDVEIGVEDEGKVLISVGVG